FVFAPMTWAQDYNIKNGLPSETYITCAEANEMAKTDSAQVAETTRLCFHHVVYLPDYLHDRFISISFKHFHNVDDVGQSI
ncbi:YmgD family protein, partial [Escherichia coli]|nr:YmgD family protein [Escherichia coli]